MEYLVTNSEAAEPALQPCEVIRNDHAHAVASWALVLSCVSAAVAVCATYRPPLPASVSWLDALWLAVKEMLAGAIGGFIALMFVGPLRQVGSLFKAGIVLSWMASAPVVILLRERSALGAAGAVALAIQAVLHLCRMPKPCGITASGGDLPIFLSYDRGPEDCRVLPRADAFIIAISSYIAVFGVLNRWLLTLTIALCLAAFLSANALAGVVGIGVLARMPIIRAKTRGMVVAAVLLFVITVAVLVPYLKRPSGVVIRAIDESLRESQLRGGRHTAGRLIRDIDGTSRPYRSVILLVDPATRSRESRGASSGDVASLRSKEEMRFRFDGTYWYHRIGVSRVGKGTHREFGDPLGVDVYSADGTPMLMEAHEYLRRKIYIAGIKSIDIGVEDKERDIGPIKVAVMLTDSGMPGSPTMYLGDRDVDTAEGSGGVKPRIEELRFDVTGNSRIKKFDEITVVFIPPGRWMYEGVKIAITDFLLNPR